MHPLCLGNARLDVARTRLALKEDASQAASPTGRAPCPDVVFHLKLVRAQPQEAP